MTRNSYDIVLLPGDGIGLEVAAQARALCELVSGHAGVKLNVQEIPCGGRFYLEHGSRDWPEGAEDKCKAADAILLGAVGWGAPGGGPVTMPDGRMAGWSAVIGNRLALDLYANVRPVKLLPGVNHGISGEFKPVWKPENVDMVIVRENTEGLYSGMGGVLARGGVQALATDTRVITREATERVVRKAFEICAARSGAPKDGAKRVTCIVKNNVLDGCKLFAAIFAELGEQFPDIETEVAIVDAFTQWVITRPEHYDVCVAPNLFGDIVTDLASVLQGGMGMAVGCNVGDDHGMFEPIHGSAPPLAGKDKANPMAMLLATGECLAWLGQQHDDQRLTSAAAAIEGAVADIAGRGQPLTEDLVGPDRAAPLSTVAAAVAAAAADRLGA